MFKYVDDTTVVVTLPPGLGIRHISTGRPEEQLPGDFLKGLFAAITASISMKVNCRKTQLICISTDNGYHTWSSIRAEDDNISSQSMVKLLGFVVGTAPGVTDHFELLKRKFQARFWSFIHLRKAGIKGWQLHKLYSTLVRQFLDVNAPVFHPMLSVTQSEAIERIQKQVFRLCFGYNTSYGRTLTELGLDSLKTRRTKAVVKFVRKALASEKFASRFFFNRLWVETEISRRRPFIEKRARTERYRNSPLLCYQKVVNDIMTEEWYCLLAKCTQSM